MERQDYSVSFLADLSPEEVFNSVNSVTKWWTRNLEGNSQNLNDEFTVRFDDIHMSKQKLTELIPYKKVVWLVTVSKLTFVDTMDEWTNTKISFDISERENKTQVDFTHHGLVPGFECYDGCSKGWDYYIKGSLYKLLTEGKGTPD
ncbi:SRPBCC domain-containing protein [Pedobacter sp. HMF7647]|uniref:SRPBCC domain-containing protein n=1 Tax=Hufsiella arboris TaxID=2695275 RepID=A0A7K1Y6E5_9SPHI|nr:SRPBCC domain-containing protein [Hufsiella arboris]MXV50133.1 SRPBCC domain-containing protein [Hufsiella arboris]